MSDTEFARYDVDLPSRAFIMGGIIVGRIILFIGIAALIITIYQWASFPDGYERYASSYGYGTMWPDNIRFHWYTWVLPLAIGIMMLIILGRQRRIYFIEVQQGRVIDKDITGGGNVSISHVLCVDGYTRANERRSQWKDVTVGTFEQYRVGDMIDFRDMR